VIAEGARRGPVLIEVKSPIRRSTQKVRRSAEGGRKNYKERKKEECMKSVIRIATMFITVMATAAAISPAFAQTITPDSSEAQALAVLQHAPMKRAPGPTARVNGVNAVKSYNWGGYYVAGTGFTEAKGSWIVPAVDCAKSPNAWVAFWVGIDGATDSTVEQIGTLTWCNRTTAQYYTWYEFYPSDPSLIVISSVPSKPGNKMSAEVSYIGSSKFTVEILDETTGKSFSTTATVSGAKRTSAEWIAEAPTTVTGIVNLADFTSASYGDYYTGIADTNYATDSTKTGVIGDFGSAVYNITQVDDTGYTESTSSALTGSGSSFKVTWIEYN
jgi:hypothetical protein